MTSIKIKTIDQLDPLQTLSLNDFSYSRIDTYKMCPSKYFYTYIQREPRSFNDAAVLGNIVHSVLEECLGNDKKLDLDILQDEYVKQKESYDPTNIIPQELVSVGSEILTEFYDKHYDDSFDIYDKEFGFSFVIGNYLVNGFIDRIDIYDDNTINIIDYKTRKMGSIPKGSPQEPTARHLRLGGINRFSWQKYKS